MKLTQIIKKLKADVYGSDQEISSLEHNSKKVKKGSLFFALKGSKFNGEDYVNEAIKNGATAIVSQRKLELPKGITNIVCKDEREAMSLCASEFYGNPAQDLFIIGVTGTNGKTTSTYMLKSIFEQSGKKVGVIGTNGSFIGSQKLASELTTPDPINLQKILKKMRDNGVEILCMEISAHALELQKIRGVTPDIALFTNLTQDHLDFFKNMENYYQAKRQLFMKENAKYGVINYDDEYGKRLVNESQIDCLTYSRNEDLNSLLNTNIIALNQKHTNSGQDFIISTPNGQENIHINLHGKFNISNALGAISAALLYGLDLKTIKQGLNNLQKVDGRFNFYDVNGVKVVIDYAHTPDGLENILNAGQELTENSKLFAVFGCGGNRDKTKRKVMGKIATQSADFTIITSDNPRFERPEDIANDILEGVQSTSYTVILDRKKAIKAALNMAKPGDVVIIAGKGSEPYLEINGQKFEYSDESVIQEILSELEK